MLEADSMRQLLPHSACRRLRLSDNVPAAAAVAASLWQPICDLRCMGGDGIEDQSGLAMRPSAKNRGRRALGSSR